MRSVLRVRLVSFADLEEGAPAVHVTASSLPPGSNTAPRKPVDDGHSYPAPGTAVHPCCSRGETDVGRALQTADRFRITKDCIGHAFRWSAPGGDGALE
ncbi:hypothetical protein PsYK624_115750 [Phanerochaete sordida]|uniref:Uncharacterized protein n=1 Tax=Phanerochaete sordida TaxID=48140 RepID=A0A9P3GI61_9APHY|nr:hypothetical protein PsYK624_115750 [Phanerochaete sordida]